MRENSVQILSRTVHLCTTVHPTPVHHNPTSPPHSHLTTPFPLGVSPHWQAIGKASTSLNELDTLGTMLGTMLLLLGLLPSVAALGDPGSFRDDRGAAGGLGAHPALPTDDEATEVAYAARRTAASLLLGGRSASSSGGSGGAPPRAPDVAATHRDTDRRARSRRNAPRYLDERFHGVEDTMDAVEAGTGTTALFRRARRLRDAAGKLDGPQQVRSRVVCLSVRVICMRVLCCSQEKVVEGGRVGSQVLASQGHALRDSGGKRVHADGPRLWGRYDAHTRRTHAHMSGVFRASTYLLASVFGWWGEVHVGGGKRSGYLQCSRDSGVPNWYGAPPPVPRPPRMRDEKPMFSYVCLRPSTFPPVIV